MKIILILLVAFSQSVWSQAESKPASASPLSMVQDDSDDPLTSLDYPELQVVPRASERLQLEAEADRADRIIDSWPLLIPATLTVVNGLRAHGGQRNELSSDEKDRGVWIARTGLAVGLGSLGLVSYFLNRKDAITTTAELKKNSQAGKRAQLYRERLSEEFLEERASFDRKLIWMSSSLNFMANAALIEYAPDTDRPLLAVGALVSFMPLFFRPRSLRTWDHHLKSKSRIYVPVAGLMLLPQGQKTVALQSLQWSWTF